MNFAKSLEISASFFPHRPALRQEAVELTYSEFNQRANRVATALLRIGLRPGEHVALYAPNSIDWVVFYYAVLKAGCVAVTLSHLLTQEELARLLEHCEPKAIFTEGSKLGTLEKFRGPDGLQNVICQDGDLDLQALMDMGTPSFEAMDRHRKDTAAVLYTGGTTGVPKGVMLTHEGIDFSSHSIAHFERSTENDSALCFMPFNHVFGQIHIMNATVVSAGCLEILQGFDMDRIVDAMQGGRVTKFYAVPTVYVRLLGLPDLESKLGNLRYCFSAAASMAMDTVRKWKERTNITIAESYGMTEAMPVTYNHYYRHVVGSVGQTVQGVEVQIRDEAGNILDRGATGEICIRGPVVMKGYLKNPEGTRSAFHPDGWLRSGDVGRFDENNYLYIVDRIKDLIITGGENVYPREVEELIYTLSGVESCAVVGLPDREWGERVTAFIVPRPGYTIVPDEVKKFLKAHLSPFKVPKEYFVVKDLPKSPAGKILKREIKRRFLESSSGNSHWDGFDKG
ncbi:MAG: class I adenylate-forming enzyme family protein [bacterium]